MSGRLTAGSLGAGGRTVTVAPGVRTYRVVWMGDADHRPNASPIRKLTVR